MTSLLIVDDDETIKDVLLEMFSGQHLCHTAATAEEALEQLESHEYDVVITDIAMPGMGGEHLLGFIKTYNPRTRVIFITGSSDKQNAGRLMAKGAVGYLVKPFNLEIIMERVEWAIKQRRGV
ncbi:MAG: response regulator [Acidobacteria bacterium]|nr:response regulator [Acidobacteriota bacterium]